MTAPSPTRTGVRHGTVHALGRRVRANLSTAELYEDAIRAGEGLVAAEARWSSGPASTPADRPRTSSSSRSPRPTTRSGGARSTDRSARPTTTACAPGSSSTSRTKDLYAQDCFIGAAPEHRRSLRVYTETAWASIFARNLFRRPTPEQLAALRPELHDHLRPVVQGRPDDRRRPQPRPRSSSTCSRMEIIIVGTEYAGEIKKSAFTVMNYLMPDEGVLPMHSAVNVGAGWRLGHLLRPLGDRQDDALGRSGAEPHRRRRARLGRRRRLQLRGRLLRRRRSASRPMYEPDIFQTTPPVRDDPRERRPRPGDPGARPRLRPVHREHPRRVSARLHRQRRRDRASPASPATSCS